MSKWQPIETAPTDGTEILGWCDGCCFVIEYWLDAWREIWGLGRVDVTHWMPLPEPPKGETE